MDPCAAILLGLDAWSSDSEAEEKTSGLVDGHQAEEQTEEPYVRCL